MMPISSTTASVIATRGLGKQADRARHHAPQEGVDDCLHRCHSPGNTNDGAALRTAAPRISQISLYIRLTSPRMYSMGRKPKAPVT
jgi:hypothetical protein